MRSPYAAADSLVPCILTLPFSHLAVLQVWLTVNSAAYLFTYVPRNGSRIVN